MNINKNLTTRTNQDLPGIAEVINLIREKESPRLGSVHNWIERHPEIFSPCRKVLGSMGIQDMFELKREVSTDVELAVLISTVETIKREFLARIGKATVLQDNLVRMYESLSQQDDQLSADAIFVFGAPSNARIDKAVELYYSNLAPKIIISGRGPNWQTDVGITEATRMSERALELGVPRDALILEHEALTIPDNVKRTLDLFEKSNFYPSRLIIIASSFAMLRAYIDWVRFPDYPIEICKIAPPIVDQDLSAEKWYTNEKGRNTVINEYAKIIHEAATNSYLRAQSDHS